MSTAISAMILVNGHTGALSLAEVIEISNSENAAFVVDGNYLKAADALSGDIVVVNFKRMPQPCDVRLPVSIQRPDICLCYVQLPGMSEPAVTLRVYTGVKGAQHLFLSIHAIHIFGVVTACYSPDGTKKWEISKSKLPKKERNLADMWRCNYGQH